MTRLWEKGGEYTLILQLQEELELQSKCMNKGCEAKQDNGLNG